MPPTQAEWDALQLSITNIETAINASTVTYSVPYTLPNGTGLTGAVTVRYAMDLGDIMLSTLLVIAVIIQITKITFNVARGLRF